MRVGILTLPLHTNYGGIIQAWALQTIIERLGHDVKILGLQQPARSSYKFPILWTVRLIRKLSGKSETPIFFEFSYNRLQKQKKGKLQDFIKKRVRTKTLKSLESISKEKFDVIVVGSDQIWRKEYIQYLWKCGHPEYAFLSNITSPRTKKIAYAPSFGKDTWEYNTNETRLISDALHSFNSVSVREISGVKLLNKYTGIEPSHVLDPTFLLNSIDYIKLLKLNIIQQQNTVSYILDPNEDTRAVLSIIGETKKQNNIELNHSHDDKPMISIEQWIEHIACASLVITDSFHGCVFSLIFRKPLIFIRNHTRGSSRFETLVKLFGIQKNCISKASDYNPANSYNLPSNLDNVMSSLQTASLNFLCESLNRNEG